MRDDSSGLAAHLAPMVKADFFRGLLNHSRKSKIHYY